MFLMVPGGGAGRPGTGGMNVLVTTSIEAPSPPTAISRFSLPNAAVLLMSPFSGIEPGVSTVSHLQMPASTGDGLMRLIGMMKLATKSKAARTPNILGYFVFIIPPKFCKLREFPLGDLRRNSTSPPPVLETLNGESIHFLIGYLLSPPVSGYSTDNPETLFLGLRLYVPEPGRLCDCLGRSCQLWLSVIRITSFVL